MNKFSWEDNAFIGLALGFILVVGSALVAENSGPALEEVMRGALTQVAPGEEGGSYVVGDFGSHQLGHISSDGGFGVVTDGEDSNFNGEIRSLQRRKGSLFVGGNFTSYGQTLVGYFAKLNLEGELDREFLRNMGTGFDDVVSKVFVLPSGDLVIAGSFQSYNGSPANGLALLKPNGKLMQDFWGDNQLDGEILSVSESKKGSILLGGNFTSLNGKSMRHLIELER